MEGNASLGNVTDLDEWLDGNLDVDQNDVVDFEEFCAFLRHNQTGPVSADQPIVCLKSFSTLGPPLLILGVSKKQSTAIEYFAACYWLAAEV